MLAVDVGGSHVKALLRVSRSAGGSSPLELAHLPFRKKTYEDYVGERALERHGKKRWRNAVFEAVGQLAAAVEPDYVVIGGGGVDKLAELPPNRRRGENENAFTGGFRLWEPAWSGPHERGRTRAQPG